MEHPLDGAWAKFDAALEHFEALGADSNAFLGPPHPYSATLEFDERESCFRLIGHLESQPPLRISTHIGDVIHNLASALDHAAFALAELRTGTEVERTSFPIYGDIRLYRSFRRQKNCWMRCLTISDRTFLQSLQPYRRPNDGCFHPLSMLYRLWNQDKHRVLHTTLAFLSEYGLKLTAVQDVAAIGPTIVRLGPVEDGAEILRIEVVTDGPVPQVKLESELTMSVAFDDGLPVRQILAEIGDFVQHILREIEKRFPSPSALSRHG